jgi:hypothetical protein
MVRVVSGNRRRMSSKVGTPQLGRQKVQISFRDSQEVKERILSAAVAIGAGDESTLLRMMVKEFLPVFEDRAKTITNKQDGAL